MGRHKPPRAKGRLATPVLVAMALVPVLLAGGLVWWLVAGSTDEAGCDQRQTVAVTVTPELESVARTVLAEPLDLGNRACAVADVTAQEPLQTVADLGALDEEAWPRVWVPDSSLWTARVTDPALETTGSLGSSPVVLATSSAVAEQAGWAAQPPSWAGALTGDHAVAMPDLAGSAEALAALAAVQASAGGGEDGDDAIVQVALTATGSGSPTPDEALAAGRDGAEDAPLVPVAEQQVLAGGDSSLVAVYPTDGSPVLDYPVVRVGAPAGSEQRAVTAVADALTSKAALDAARQAGFRGPDGAAPPGAGPDTGTQEAAPQPLELTPDQVETVLGTLASVATPSRMLAVFDVSTSMAEPVGSGTRATLARDAGKSALTLLPDDSAIGLWVFAAGLDGSHDWAELQPIRRLSVDAGGRPQRDALNAALDSIPDRLSPGGTGLYDTVLAAVRTVRQNYDPNAVNSVVIVTDGRDDDGTSIGRARLLQTLTAEIDEDRPVRVIGIALGPDADLPALQEITKAAGGAAYSAEDPKDLQNVLFDALRRRQ